MPTPKKGESKKAFIKRCVVIRQGEHPHEKESKSQEVCHLIYQEENTGGK